MKRLVVYYGNRIAGYLTGGARSLVFEYDAEWLSWEGAFPLTPRMPLAPGTITDDEPVLFFSNLLPEGPVLKALLKLKRLPESDIFAQLNAFGEDAAGAFSITPEGPRKPRTPEYIPYPAEEIVSDLKEMKRELPLIARHGELRLSLAGAQNKIAVKHDGNSFWLPAGGAASTHILKAPIHPEGSFPESVHNEALCLALSAACGLETAHAHISRLPKPVLMVSRYDRVENSGLIERVHQLDFCQLTGRLPDHKYEEQGGPALTEIGRVIDLHSKTPGRDKLRLLEWVIFNYLIGNADAHAKNLAMLVAPGGGLVLAPFYDMLATWVYPTLDTRVALGIGGAYRPERVYEEHWRTLASDIGATKPARMRERALEIVSAASQSFPGIADKLGIPHGSKFLRKFRRLLADRARRLELNLPK